MFKKILIVVAVILVIAGGIGAYYLLPDKNEETISASGTSVDTSQKAQAELTKSEGIYVVYSEDEFKDTKSERVLFFHDASCEQCVELEDNIKNSKIPENVTIFVVDYSSNPELAQKYNVQTTPTLVKVDENGNEVKKFVAYDEPNLDAVIANLL